MRAITLMFHDVVPDNRWESSGFPGVAADLYKLDCQDFHRHLEAISCVPGRQVVTALDLLETPIESPVLITFDDGGVSAALYIADMLEEFSWKGHFLVTAGRVGTEGFLNRAQIRALHQRGHIIGSHSYSHPLRMSNCSVEELDREWKQSVHVLTDILGAPVRVASVPGGGYSRNVALTAADAGIRVLFNSEPITRSHKVNDCLVLGRFGAKRGHSPQWSAAIVAGHSPTMLRDLVFWNTKKAAKFVLGDLWLRVRTKVLRDVSE